MNKFVTFAQLEAELTSIENSPTLQGTVDLIVCRPEVNQRAELEQAVLTLEDGLLGDNWRSRQAHIDTQLNLINSRVMAALEKNQSRWQLAGDQFYVDFDLSKANTPAGTRLKIGSAIIEVTAEPHLACGKFADRFGRDAARFVNSSRGKSLNLRGINAKVILPGEVTLGACIARLET